MSNTKDQTRSNGVLIFDTNSLYNQPNIPTEFVWPHGDLVHNQDDLKEPLIDLSGFFGGDDVATAHVADVIRVACMNHGCFQVINHGVDQELIVAAHKEMDTIFNLRLDRKLSVKRQLGSIWGYSGAHVNRFSCKLPWKETFTFGYHENCDSHEQLLVADYFSSVLGQDFKHTGLVYQIYCEEMTRLSQAIFELLAISLGVDRMQYRKFFEDGNSIMRCNYYPPCSNANLTLGSGPHCDPTSLTILHQDQVGGLEVFANNKWQAIKPRQDALVVNVGDTFMALSNGIYKSCLHRALVNKDKDRRSLAFFVCPKEDRVVRSPQDLVCRTRSRKYPDFTWSLISHGPNCWILPKTSTELMPLLSQPSFLGFFLLIKLLPFLSHHH